MSFLYIFSGIFISALGFFLFRVLYIAHRESINHFFDKRVLFSIAKNIDFNLSLAIDLAIALLIGTIFSSSVFSTATLRSSAIWLGVLAFATPRVLRAGSFITSRLRKQNREKLDRPIKRTIMALFLLTIGILELSAFNSSASRSDHTEPVALTDIKIIKGAYYDQEEQKIVIIDSEVSLRIDHSISGDEKMNLNLHYSDGSAVGYYNINVRSDNKYYLDSAYMAPTNDQDLNIFAINSCTSFDFLLLDISYINISGNLTLEKIDLCAPLPLVVSPVRLILLAALGTMLIFWSDIFKGLKINKHISSDYRPARNKVLLAGGALFLFALVYVLCHQDRYFTAYPFTEEGLYEQSIYQQLFDAIRKGRFDLDITPSADLINLSNPYDPYLRANIDFLWDHAFYNDRYYCYYGIAPVFLVMFPLYFITGQVPLNYTIMLFGSIIMVVAFILLLLELAKNFAPGANRHLRNALIFITILASALLVVMGTNDDFYHIPYIFGLAFAFLFIYFTFLARRHQSKRWLYLLFAGTAFIVVICSRPNLALTLLFTAPLFLRMLFESKRHFKQKMLDFVPMFSVLLLGAIWVGYYNYKRFDNIFEFGQFYQLTVVDSTKLKLQWSSIYPTFYHFFFKSPTNTGGYIIGFNPDQLPFENHPYQVGMLGLLQNPFFWPILAIPFALKRREKWDFKLFCYLIIPTLFIIALATYCYAGVCPRYVADLFPIAGVLSFIVLISLSEKYQSKKYFNHFYLPGLIVLSAVGVFFGISVLFNNFDGVNGDIYLGFFNLLRKAINLFNF